MNAPFPIEGSLVSASDASIQAARWRGQCVDYYAQIEFLVGSALCELRNSGSEGSQPAPFTYRTKIAGLRDAVKDKYDGLFRTLEKLHCACERRNLIVHASSTVTLTPAGDWFWTGCYIASDREAGVAVEAIARPEAIKFEKELKGTVQSLKSHLSSLKREAVTE